MSCSAVQKADKSKITKNKPNRNLFVITSAGQPNATKKEVIY